MKILETSTEVNFLLRFKCTLNISGTPLIYITAVVLGQVRPLAFNTAVLLPITGVSTIRTDLKLRF